MNLSDQTQTVSYLKEYASEIVRTLGDRGEPVIITQDGEAKAVLQDIHSYKQTQETMAMLKILAAGNRQIEANRVKTAEEVFSRLNP